MFKVLPAKSPGVDRWNYLTLRQLPSGALDPLAKLLNDMEKEEESPGAVARGQDGHAGQKCRNRAPHRVVQRHLQSLVASSVHADHEMAQTL